MLRNEVWMLRKELWMFLTAALCLLNGEVLGRPASDSDSSSQWSGSIDSESSQNSNQGCIYRGICYSLGNEWRVRCALQCVCSWENMTYIAHCRPIQCPTPTLAPGCHEVRTPVISDNISDCCRNEIVCTNNSNAHSQNDGVFYINSLLKLLPENNHRQHGFKSNDGRDTTFHTKSKANYKTRVFIPDPFAPNQKNTGAILNNNKNTINRNRNNNFMNKYQTPNRVKPKIKNYDNRSPFFIYNPKSRNKGDTKLLETTPVPGYYYYNPNSVNNQNNRVQTTNPNNGGFFPSNGETFVTDRYDPSTRNEIPSTREDTHPIDSYNNGFGAGSNLFVQDSKKLNVCSAKNGNSYKVGQQWVEKCAAKCACAPGSTPPLPVCTPLCPPQQVNPGCYTAQNPNRNDAKGTDCCDIIICQEEKKLPATNMADNLPNRSQIPNSHIFIQVNQPNTDAMQYGSGCIDSKGSLRYENEAWNVGCNRQCMCTKVNSHFMLHCNSRKCEYHLKLGCYRVHNPKRNEDTGDDCCDLVVCPKDATCVDTNGKKHQQDSMWIQNGYICTCQHDGQVLQPVCRRTV